MQRRTFIGMAAAASLRAANDPEPVRVGLIGSGGRGQYLAGVFRDHANPVCAVCDVYEPRLAEGLQVAAPGARTFADYRKLLEDKSIEAVIIATPDHWHANMLVDAVSAGKDVYIEKPMALKVEDAFRMVAANQRAGRVVQLGTQRRSNPMFLEAAEILKSGAVGDVRMVNAWWYNRQSKLNQGPLEGKLDWDMWLGPAPKRSLDPVRFQNWLYFWDYAGGYLCGQGAHIVDGIQMLMRCSYPVAVTASAGKARIPGAEIPETTCLSIEFPEFLAVFNCSYQAMHYAFSLDQMKQFNGSLGRFDVARESFALYPQTESRDMKPSVEKRAYGSFEPSSRLHVRNFLDCVRSRQTPHATLEMGCATSVILAMGLESLRTGRRIRWDAENRRMA